MDIRTLPKTAFTENSSLWLLNNYYMYDDFTTPRAALAINGTAAEPTGNIRFVRDTGSKLTLSGGLFSMATGQTAGDGIWIPCVSTARTLGTTLLATITPANTTQNFEVGFDSDTVVATTDNLSFQASGSLNARAGGGSMPCGTYAGATSYQIAIVLRPTGSFYFIKGGAFTNWTLLMSASSGNATHGYAAIASRTTTSILTADKLRVSKRLYVPVPLESDGFSTTTTDGLGNPEGNGPVGHTYTNVGTWGITGGKRVCSVLSTGIGFSYLATSSSNVLIEAVCSRTAGATGIVARYADANNYLIAYHDGTNCKLDKVVAGVTTNLISAVATYSATAILRLSVDGTDARLFYNNATIGTLAVAPASSSFNHGLYTTDTNATFDNFVVWPRGTENEYVGLNAL